MEDHPKTTRPTVREAIEAQGAARHAAIERQLDTEELHKQLGQTGLSRLMHPIRNARITSTVLNRQRKGEYIPDLAKDPPAIKYDWDGNLITVSSDPIHAMKMARAAQSAERQRSTGEITVEPSANPFADLMPPPQQPLPADKKPFLDD